MVDVSIVNGVSKPTNISRGPPCRTWKDPIWGCDDSRHLQHMTWTLFGSSCRTLWQKTVKGLAGNCRWYHNGIHDLHCHELRLLGKEQDGIFSTRWTWMKVAKTNHVGVWSSTYIDSQKGRGRNDDDDKLPCVIYCDKPRALIYQRKLLCCAFSKSSFYMFQCDLMRTLKFKVFVHQTSAFFLLQAQAWATFSISFWMALTIHFMTQKPPKISIYCIPLIFTHYLECIWKKHIQYPINSVPNQLQQWEHVIKTCHDHLDVPGWMDT